MTRLVLAIDGGSQSTKVSIVDEHGVVRAGAQAVLRPYELGPGGRAVHPDDDLWDTLVTASRRTLAAFDGSLEDIVAVGLCGIRFCRALMDADGRLTEPVLSWMDARVSRPLEDVDPRVATVASAGGYLAVRLTGARRDSAASYQGMWPIDPVARNWSAEPTLIDSTGMPLALLPELVDPGDLLGHLTAQASSLTGIPAGLPVFATANDKAVEALGCGLVEPGSVLLSLGTYIASMTVGEEPTAADERYWVNSASVPGRYLYESGGIRRGMWTVSWLRDLVRAAAPDLVDAHTVQEWLNEGARHVPPGSGGLMTIPDWLAPGHAPHRRGAILGFTGAHDAHHLYRSILEGIVLTMRGHTEAMEDALGRAPGRLLLSGGGARSNLMTQIVADVFGRPVERSDVADAAGLGAAVCAAVGAAIHPDFDTAVKAMTRTGEVFVPNPAAHRQYDRIMAVYSQLTTFTDPLFEQLTSLSAQ